MGLLDVLTIMFMVAFGGLQLVLVLMLLVDRMCEHRRETMAVVDRKDTVTRG